MSPQRSDPWPTRKNNPRKPEEPKHADRHYPERMKPGKFEKRPGWEEGLSDEDWREVWER